MDSEGNTSEASVQIISKDTQAPADVALTVTTYDKTSITVNATGTDQGSGIISYAFQISQTENEEDFTTVETVASTENTCAYTYTGLTLGTRYYLRVIVTDIAGYSTVSEIVKRSTQDNGVTDTVLAESIGKYVDYTPISGSFTSSRVYNGYNYDQNFSTNTDTQWRILFVNNDTVTLIAENLTNSWFYFEGWNGYNNGVKLLNDACKAMYSNSSLGAVARSIKIEDIENVSSYDKATYTNYGKEYSPSSYKAYPNIFKQEFTGSVEGRYGSTLGLSDQAEYVTGYDNAGVLGGKWTFYTYAMSTSYMPSIYVELFSSDTQYWIASRCVNYEYITGYDYVFKYRMFYSYGSSIAAYILLNSLFRSDVGDNWAHSCALRPVVEIDLDSVTIGRIGDGSRNSQYSIEAQ